MRRFLCVLLTLLFVLASPLAVVACDDDQQDTTTGALVEQLEQLEEQIDCLEEQIEELEEQLDEAKDAGDDALADTLEEQLEGLEEDKDELEEQKDALEEQIEELEEAADEEDADDRDKDDDDKDDAKEVKPWEQAKNTVEQQKDAIEELKDALEAQIRELEKQYDALKEDDPEAAEALLEQIGELQEQKRTYKTQMMQMIDLMGEIMKQKYTQEELDNLAAIGEELESAGIEVLPVTSVFANIKFDTPPVIKEGRTLIPLRAVSEATGATVAWNEADKTITVAKGEQEIVLKLDSRTIYLNGVEQTIDAAPMSINNRTVVPLRFIVEEMGLQVDWSPESRTIAIQV